MPPTRGWGGVSPPAPLRAALLPVFLSLPFPSLLPFLFFHRRGGRRARQPLGCSEISRPPSTPAAQMQWITLMVLLFISSVEMLAQNRWKKQGRAHAERGYLVLPQVPPVGGFGSPTWSRRGCHGGHQAPGAASSTESPPGLFPTSVHGEGKAQPQRHHLPCASVVPPGVAGDRGQLVARGPKSQPPGAGCGWWAQGAALCRCFCSMPWVQNVLGGCSEVLSPAPSFPPELLLGCPRAVPGGTGSCPLRRVVPPQPGLCAVRDQGSLL